MESETQDKPFWQAPGHGDSCACPICATRRVDAELAELERQRNEDPFDYNDGWVPVALALILVATMLFIAWRNMDGECTAQMQRLDPERVCQ